SKYAVTSVTVNTNAPISIDAGSSKIVQVEPGNYNIKITNTDGLKFDTSINVVDHEEVLRRNPKQTSVRYLINPPDKPPVVAAKKTNEIKRIERPIGVDNSKLGTKVDYLKTVTTQLLQNLEGINLKLNQQNAIVLKGDNAEITKQKTLLQIKAETTAILQNAKSQNQKLNTDITQNISEYNTLIQELQKAKPDNDANKILFQKATDIQKNLIKLQEVALTTTQVLNNTDIIITPKLQGLKPMSDNLEVALSHNRTDDYKFFVTPKTINNLKVGSKNIINYLIDEKANYETFFYFMQQGLEVNDFNNTVAGENGIFNSPLLKACMAELDSNTIDLLLKNGAKLSPTITFPERKKANNQYLYNKIKNNNTLLLLFNKYGFSFKQ
ncbi:MAG: hypothetical protein H7101_07505, partial [Deinococcales bacterium]|nr:hypothetical protein [Chitinophagaceae bacterium]